MTTNDRTEPGVCTRCGGTRVIPIGDGYSVDPCPNCTGQQPARLLAKHQPCGCIVCTCADDVRCHGCGAWHCGTHPVSEIPNAIYEQPARAGSGEVALVRFGLQWNGPREFVCTPMADGYWTPWHIAQSALTAITTERDALRRAIAEPAPDIQESVLRKLGVQEQLAAAQQRIAALERDLKNERARGIHTCYDQCPRPLCVAHREIADLRNRLNLNEKLHRRFPVDAVQPDQKDVS